MLKNILDSKMKSSKNIRRKFSTKGNNVNNKKGGNNKNAFNKKNKNNKNGKKNKENKIIDKVNEKKNFDWNHINNHSEKQKINQNLITKNVQRNISIKNNRGKSATGIKRKLDTIKNLKNNQPPQKSSDVTKKDRPKSTTIKRINKNIKKEKIMNNNMSGGLECLNKGNLINKKGDNVKNSKNKIQQHSNNLTKNLFNSRKNSHNKRFSKNKNFNNINEINNEYYNIMKIFEKEKSINGNKNSYTINVNQRNKKNGVNDNKKGYEENKDNKTGKKSNVAVINSENKMIKIEIDDNYKNNIEKEMPKCQSKNINNNIKIYNIKKDEEKTKIAVINN